MTCSTFAKAITVAAYNKSHVGVFDPGINIEDSFNVNMDQQNNTQNINETTIGSGNTIYGDVGSQTNGTLNLQSYNDKAAAEAKDRTMNYVLNLL